MTAQVCDFDPSGALPTGTMVLEASAGTGKTHAIVSLAVRYLADGVPVDRLLMVTFSRGASNELRDRMRSRIAECLAALDDPWTIRNDAAADEVLRTLCAGTDDEVAVRRRRLAEAMSDFDAATVATTHTFCNRMLGALGFLGERSQQYPIMEDVSDLTSELTSDLYLGAFAGAPDRAPSWEVATAVAKEAVNQAATELSPADDQVDAATKVRLDLARAARDGIAARKKLARIRTYDDLQDVLHRIVTDPGVGDRARTRIREQFSVVLIDEFQDTDPQQWAIVRACFHEAEGIPLILVGDPKQSIYGFRGAEVRSYLAAVQKASQQRRLSINWRSDGPLVKALEAVFAGTEFGDRAITFHPVAAQEQRSRLWTGDDPASAGTVDPQAQQAGRAFTAPLRLRALVPGDFGSGDLPNVNQVRQKVIDDVAADITALLSSDTMIEAGRPPAARRVEPGDIAVLVNVNRHVEPLQAALRRRGVASVVRSGTSIFKTPAARHWWYVLAAIEQPSSTAKVRLAALTPLVGRTAQELDAGDAVAGELAAEFAAAGRVFTSGGFAAMAVRLFGEFGTDARLLAAENGERLLTDLRQLSDLCNRHVAGGSAGLSSLVAWLGQQIADPSAMRHGDAQTRRLDRDTRAVQIMTVHASKGLEFPIVYVPFGWDGARRPNQETFVYHDRAGLRLLDVGGPDAAGYADREDRSIVEGAGESLRLLYVAMTRARSQVVAWWGPSMPTKQGALHRLAFTVGDRTSALQAGYGGTSIPVSVEIPSTGMEMVTGLRELASSAPDQISVEPAGRHETLGGMLRWRPPAESGDVPDLHAAVFNRHVDQGWRRTSYSGITRDAHAHAPAAVPARDSSEPETPIVDDETDSVDELASGELAGAADPGGPDEPGGMPSLMNGLPFGAGFGTLVHEVLEHVDTSAPDLAAHVLLRTREGALRRGVELDVDRLAAALVGVLTTPLGFGDLASIGPADRLAELDFEFALAAPGFTLDTVGDLLAAHLPADDLLRVYADRVRTVSDECFRGYLTGSIDSVLRIRDSADVPEGRFVVVDYKTNRLRPGDLTLEDFGAEAMAAEMMLAHYPLQALLYSVALHRYLRWRLPAYEPRRHLGPVQYQFVRGMAGPDTPPGCGVFEWRIPPELVVALSDLLAGKAPDEGADSDAESAPGEDEL
ncbi:MAG: UvrD-helicase domain-containing protein [Gordonia sp. (in: high G+C Gram-positive bacteria)]